MKNISWCLITILLPAFGFSESSNADVVLNFDSLPSAQGFNYFATGNGSGASETSVFSVDGASLHMNTMGLPLGNAGANEYRTSNVLLPNEQFFLNWRARVLEDEGDAAFGHAGFVMRVGTEVGRVYVGMSTSRILVLSGSDEITITNDNTAFQEFAVVATPGVGWNFLIDGNLVHQGLLFDASSTGNFLQFGDGTGHQNTRTELNYLRLAQTAVPEPGSFLLLGSVVVATVLRRRGRTSQHPQPGDEPWDATERRWRGFW